MKHAAALAAATPDTRDRYIDLLRVASLAIVIIGHWFMAVILIGPDGVVTATNTLALLPWLQPATWLLQVMPVFFLVGGFSHATALASLERRGGTYADFVRSRAGRLLRPTAVFVTVWLAFALVVELTGHDRGVLRLATQTVAQPLWFVGVYLGVVALAPAMLRLHRLGATVRLKLGGAAVRIKLGGETVPILLGGAAAVVDIARFVWGVPDIAYLNVAFVWLAAHQLGFLYADGTLTRDGRAGRRTAISLATAGLAAMAAMTAFGPYPMSMVGMPGDRLSNMSPPTVALLAHVVWLTGLVLLLREPLSRWLQRPRVWANVIAANGLAMTAFLWHLTAMFAATALTVALDLAQPAVGSPEWWLLRPVWLAALALLTAAMVLLFRRADQPRPVRVTAATWEARGRTVAAAGGMVLAVLGVLGLSVVGFGGVIAGRTATLAVLPVTALLSMTVLAAGAALLVSTRPAKSTRLRVRPSGDATNAPAR